MIKYCNMPYNCGCMSFLSTIKYKKRHVSQAENNNVHKSPFVNTRIALGLVWYLKSGSFSYTPLVILLLMLNTIDLILTD